MLVTILKKRWSIVFTREGLRAGDSANCDDATAPGKKIRIDPKEKGQRKLELLLHEFLHAADWSKDESWVGEVADDMSRALWKLGYRCTEGE